MFGWKILEKLTFKKFSQFFSQNKLIEILGSKNFLFIHAYYMILLLSP